MISVTLREPNRTFYLYVGNKRVGKVLCKGNGVVAYTTECQNNDDYDFLGWRRSLRDATRAILEAHGYGKPEGVIIKRKTGIR